MIRHVSAVAIVLVLNATPLFSQGAGTPIAELAVKGTAADVHKSPTVASPVIGKAPSGTVLQVRRNLGSWVEVSWPSTETGIAYLHVNTGTITARAQTSASNGIEAAAPQTTATGGAATAAANSSARTGQPMAISHASSNPESYVSLPPHHVGVGALMNASQPGFGATARMWWNNRLGAQFSASRPELVNPAGLLVRSTQFAPSVLYSRPDGVTNSVWLRPYAGAGPRFYRANQETGLGFEAFGGTEATLAAMPQFAFSADIGYRWSRPSLNGFEPRRFGFSVSGHWYVK